MEKDTIAAIATPKGSGGIGIIKISGKNAIPIAEKIFHKKGKTKDANKNQSGNCLKSHQLTLGLIKNATEDTVLDEVLMSVMKGPNSYTGEDVVEINAHSGYLVLKSILELVLENGARVAEPGEFTKRAFLNEKIDITRAEAIADLINAKNKSALKIAANQIQGSISKIIKDISNRLKNILVEIEGAIDFPDQMKETVNLKKISVEIKSEIIDIIEELLNNFIDHNLKRDGIKIAIAGRRNVGKSSLMNRLLKKERVIVTPTPGTTRDLIEEQILIKGIQIVITDTAGIGKTNDCAENLGIKKSKEAIQKANIILFVKDASKKENVMEPLIAEIKNKKTIIVLNKKDLVSKKEVLKQQLKWKAFPAVCISALKNEGLEELKKSIEKQATEIGGKEINQTTIVPNIRQKKKFEKSLVSSQRIIKGIETGRTPELIAIDIKETYNTLNSILGKNTEIEFTDEIFRRFCIGK